MTPKTKTLYKFQDQGDVDKWVHGSDASSGGLSTSNFDLTFDGQGARFHGNLSLRVKPEYEGIYRGGFAGIKTRVSNCASFSPT
jgi:NADH dehydrogenase [ubiquinone] 1 alpha subcomplex assembly factor 1